MKTTIDDSVFIIFIIIIIIIYYENLNTDQGKY